MLGVGVRQQILRTSLTAAGIGTLLAVWFAHYALTASFESASATGNSSAACPFEAQPGRTVVVFNTYLRSDKSAEHASSDVKDMNLPAGSYRVQVSTYDNHDDDDDDDDQESWYMRLKDAGGSVISTNASPDLPGDVNQQSFTTHEDFAVGGALVSAQAIHAAFQGDVLASSDSDDDDDNDNSDNDDDSGTGGSGDDDGEDSDDGDGGSDDGNGNDDEDDDKDDDDDSDKPKSNKMIAVCAAFDSLEVPSPTPSPTASQTPPTPSPPTPTPTNPPNECSIHLVHDANSNDSQFLTIDATSGAFSALGPQHDNHDIEGLDIHPQTKVLFGSAGDAGDQDGNLYIVDKASGALNLVGNTGFVDIGALAFRPTDNSLWGWGEKDEALITINTATGAGTEVFSHGANIEGLAWSKDGATLYASSGTSLYAFNPADNSFTKIADNLPGSTESLATADDGLLLGGIHNASGTTIYAYNVDTLTPVGDKTFNTGQFNDIEGIAWPAGCGNPIPNPSPSPSASPTAEPSPSPTEAPNSPPTLEAPDTITVPVGQVQGLTAIAKDVDGDIVTIKKLIHDGVLPDAGFCQADI